MRFKSVILLGLFGMTVGMIACGGRPSPGKPRLYPGKIAIGLVDWPGYLALYVARDHGLFREEGLDVELKIYPSHTGYIEDFLAGKIQGVTNLSNEVVDQTLRGFDQRIVLVIDYSNGADGIAAGPGLTSLNQAKGKKVAFERGTLEEYFLLYALGRNGLSLKDVVAVDLNPEKSAEALVDGKVDIAVTYEPFLSEALKKTKGNLIFSSADAPGLITDVFTFRTDFVTAHPETMAALVRAYFRAIRFWKENPDETHALLAKQLGTTQEDVVQQLKGVTILDKNENRTALTFSVGEQSLYGNMRHVADFVLRLRDKEGTAVDTDHLIEKKFVREFVKGQGD